MKRMSVLLSVLWGFLSVAAGAVAAPIVRLEGPPAPPGVGETFSLQVYVAGVTETFWDPLSQQTVTDELLAFGFDVVYPSPVSFLGAQVASPFSDDSSSFPNTDVAGSAFPGVSGDGIPLATLEFSAAAAGGYVLGVASDSTDLNEGLVTLQNFLLQNFLKIDFSKQVDVQVTGAPGAPAVVPEPSTLLLLGAGLGCLGWARRRA